MESFLECGSHHSLTQPTHEGLLRKEPPAEHSAFEALTERVTQITTAFQQKNHNYEGCHAVRLLSWLTVVVAATQHSILGEVQATARIQAEVASRLGGAGRGARAGQRRTMAIAKMIEEHEMSIVDTNQSEEVIRNASFRQDPHRQNNHS